MDLKLQIKVDSIINIDDTDNEDYKNYTFYAKITSLNDLKNITKKRILCEGEFKSTGINGFSIGNKYNIVCSKDSGIYHVNQYGLSSSQSKNSIIKKIASLSTLSDEKEIEFALSKTTNDEISMIDLILIADEFAMNFNTKDKSDEFKKICNELHDYYQFLILVTNDFKNNINSKVVEKFYDYYKKNAFDKYYNYPFLLCSYGASLIEVHNLINNEEKFLNNAAEAAIYLTIKNAYEENGDIYLKSNEIKPIALELLKECNYKNAKELLDNILYYEYQFIFPIVQKEGCYYIKQNYDIEKSIIDRINKINIQLNTFRGKKLNDYIKKNKEILDKRQLSAIRQIFKYKISVITGGAGTGKTYVIKKIIEAIKEVACTDSIELLAPTGKAVERLKTTTGFEAKTIHRAINFNGYFKKDSLKKIDAKYIIVDESSMIDNNLLYYLLESIQNDATIVLIGDSNQLCPVCAGDAFYALCHCKNIAKTILTKTYRQDESSEISSLANLILKSKATLTLNKETDNLTIKNFENDDKLLKYIKNLNDTFNDYAYLCLTNQNKISVNSINNIVRKKLYNTSKKFVINEKIMQIKNNPILGIYNGEIGKIVDIFDNEKKYSINFNNNIVNYSKSNLRELTYAYAITIHKSQGSEFDNVILVLDKQSYKMIDKSLMYTAVTRAKKNLIILNSINNIDDLLKIKKRRRNTNISNKISHY